MPGTADAAPAADADAAITFDRAVYFLEADPGERISERLVIKNSTAVSPTFASERVDMVSGEGSGSRAFQYVPLGDAPRGAGSWIEPITPASITIAPFDQVELDLVVDVPSDAGAGGHFAAVIFTAPDPRPEAQVRFDVNQPVAIFITVRGEFERDVRVSATPTDRWRWSGGLATWEVRIRNEGDVHEPVSGRLRLDGLFGGAGSSRIDAGILFPGEERTQRVRFGLRSAPDVVRGTARVELDDRRPAIDAAPLVAVLPWWVLVLLAVAIVVVVLRVRARRGRRDDAPLDDADDEVGRWIGPAG